MQRSLFYDCKQHSEPLGRGGAVNIFSQTMTYWINLWINHKAVCRKSPATPGLLIIYSSFRWRKDVSIYIYIFFYNQKYISNSVVQKYIAQIVKLEVTVPPVMYKQSGHWHKVLETGNRYSSRSPNLSYSKRVRSW